MTISLYIDKVTKRKASRKAKKDKLSFSAVARILLSDYAEGKIVIGTRPVAHYEVSEILIDHATQGKMDSIVKKWLHKKS